MEKKPLMRKGFGDLAARGRRARPADRAPGPPISKSMQLFGWASGAKGKRVTIELSDIEAALLSIPATIVMPVTTPFVKVAATKAHGADIVLDGETIAAHALRPQTAFSRSASSPALRCTENRVFFP